MYLWIILSFIRRYKVDHLWIILSFNTLIHFINVFMDHCFKCIYGSPPFSSHDALHAPVKLSFECFTGVLSCRQIIDGLLAIFRNLFINGCGKNISVIFFMTVIFNLFRFGSPLPTNLQLIF